tara:strand:+ start:2054 stop:2395 length:342 start_codon:yes stop_codon:yes gene_type:complete
VVFKTDSARLVNEVVPESFRFGAEHFKEVTNVHGSGIFYRFEHQGVVNIIYIIVQADRGPFADVRAGQFTMLIEVDNKYIQTDSDLTALEVQAFCLSYIGALLEKKRGGGGPG